MLDVLLDRDAFDDPPCLPIQLELQLVQLYLIPIDEVIQLPDQHIHPLSHLIEVLMVRGVLNSRYICQHFLERDKLRRAMQGVDQESRVLLILALVSAEEGVFITLRTNAHPGCRPIADQAKMDVHIHDRPII